MWYKIFAVFLIVGGCMAVVFHSFVGEPATPPVISEEIPQEVAREVYLCSNDQTISAVFYESKEAVATSDQPTPTGSVALTLSDGRELTLKQTISASGVRFSDGDPAMENGETFVFWSKGDGALVLENNEQKTYQGCVVTAPATAQLPNIYHDDANGFTLRYPDGWTIGQTATSTRVFSALKLMVPTTLASGTNLSADTNIAIEVSTSTSCSSEVFTDMAVASSSQTIGGVEYSVASSSDAGAGNFYEEYIYALPNTRPCLAIHYFVHSTNIGNYEPGTIQEFARTSLFEQFDLIRDSLRFAQ